ncbi:hypothetical protein GTS_56840 [Gandjariella thermophila]|uniref:Mutator family transposase n=1 Tax=Gandjariella thermophila TaxID=1931992 RepID=A0A4D4JBK7_9PSEU|nr:hypothetical protein GTS_56840 [Gandjariella thermophila]
MLSLSAKGLTTGEVSAHLGEVYGASVSKDTISAITDRVLEGMAEWQSRPLDPVYPHGPGKVALQLISSRLMGRSGSQA